MSSIRDRWATLVEDFDASRLTVQGFRERRGVSPASFCRWRRTLRDAQEPGAKASFVEAVVGPSEDAAPVVELGGRFRVAVPRGFDGPTLARLVVLLERMGADGGAASAAEARP